MEMGRRADGGGGECSMGGMPMWHLGGQQRQPGYGMEGRKDANATPLGLPPKAWAWLK